MPVCEIRSSPTFRSYRFLGEKLSEIVFGKRGKKVPYPAGGTGLILRVHQRGHWEYAIKEGTTFSGLEPVVESKVLQFGAVEDPRSVLERMVDEIVHERARRMIKRLWRSK